MVEDQFTNRREAGLRLAARLAHFEGEPLLVLGLPRGGVVVAAEIARALRAPLDVLVVRKLGAPGQPELAAGAVTDGEDPQAIFNEQVIERHGISQEYLDEEMRRQLAEVHRRQTAYRGGRAAFPVEGRTVILVDDGIATGATVRAAIETLRRRRPGRLVLAVPVAPQDTVQMLEQHVDELVCLHAARAFTAVGAFYGDFRQITDEEVVVLLQRDPPAPTRSA
jgi:putative phosphoribosyl transferase